MDLLFQVIVSCKMPTPTELKEPKVSVIISPPTFDLDPYQPFNEEVFQRTVNEILSDASSFETSFDDYSGPTNNGYGFDGVSEDQRQKLNRKKTRRVSKRVAPGTSTVEGGVDSTDAGARSKYFGKPSMVTVTRRDITRVDPGSELGSVSSEAVDDGNGGVSLGGGGGGEGDNAIEIENGNGNGDTGNEDRKEKDPVDQDQEDTEGHVLDENTRNITTDIPSEDNNVKPIDNNNQAKEPTAATNHPDTPPAEDTTEEEIIFSSVSLQDRANLLQFIVSHEFMRDVQIPVKRSARRRFVRDLRKEATAKGMEKAAVNALVIYVRNTFYELYGSETGEPEGSAFGDEIIDDPDDDGRDGGDLEDGKRKRKRLSSEDKDRSRKTRKRVSGEVGSTSPALAEDGAGAGVESAETTMPGSGPVLAEEGGIAIGSTNVGTTEKSLSQSEPIARASMDDRSNTHDTTEQQSSIPEVVVPSVTEEHPETPDQEIRNQAEDEPVVTEILDSSTHADFHVQQDVESRDKEQFTGTTGTAPTNTIIKDMDMDNQVHEGGKVHDEEDKLQRMKTSHELNPIDFIKEPFTSTVPTDTSMDDQVQRMDSPRESNPTHDANEKDEDIEMSELHEGVLDEPLSNDNKKKRNFRKKLARKRRRAEKRGRHLQQTSGERADSLEQSDGMGF